VRLRHADGSWRTWAVQVDNRLDDPGIRSLVMLARDVSRSLAASTVEADVLLRELVTSAPFALLTLDCAGRVRFATGAGLTLEPAQLVGHLLSDYAETDEHRDLLDRARRGERVDEVSRWDERWWQVRFTPLVHEDVVDGAVGVFTDVTDRALAEQALAASEAHLRGVLDAVREALVVVDRDGCITSGNERFRELFGDRAVPGRYLQDAVDTATAAMLDRQLSATADPAGDRCETRLRSRTGVPVELLVSASPVRTDDVVPLGAVVVLTDITAHKERERRLSAAALTDPVTGVGNRALLGDRLEQALARRGGGVAVLFVDVDRLKQVNDGHGHAAGDTLLRAVAARIRSALRPADTLVRYGGDEFVVVCDSLPDAEEAAALAERIRTAVAVPLALGPERTTVTPTVSIGVATAPPRSSAVELLAAADAAAYAAKAAGRDTVRRDR
jgi:diguanylate cyclase (GGDEF)-like protein/PAS domain S-box-containing protein